MWKEILEKFFIIAVLYLIPPHLGMVSPNFYLAEVLNIFIPQIRPINWFILFLYFNICFFVTINKIFFLSSINVNKRVSGRYSFTNYNYLI